MKKLWLCATCFILWLAASGAAAQTVTVVNIIPQPNSPEANDDSEPNIAVNPANPSQIAATAFTPDSSGATNLVPIFLSNDGGQTWTETSIVAVAANNNCPATCDITLRFGGSSNTLYIGWLDGLIPIFGSPSIEYNIGRTTPFPGAPTVTVLENIAESTSFRDQPFVQATTVIGDPTGGAGNDRLYAGSNDGAVSPKSATIDQSMNVATAAPPAGLSAVHPELRTDCFDGPPIRPAMHPDGTVYAVFDRWTTCTGTSAVADVILVRDDNWGRGSPAYSAITDPSDSIAGVKVAAGISIPFNSTTGYADIGTERVGPLLSIAVDPRNSRIVYVAWGSGTGAANYVLTVARSGSGGASGSWTTVKTVTGATNPALAVTIRGKLGFLYQRLVSPGTCNGKGAATACWETHLETSDDFGSTWPTNLAMANLPDLQGPSPLNPSIGDYDHLLAIGKDFFGIFSGYNGFGAPSSTNFPQGITFQRFNDGAGNYFNNAAHSTAVGNSVDPFFFHVAEESAGDDFYVRDWTDSPTSGDDGAEPSTHSVFYATSDVWNRRGTLDGSPFPNDQPANEDAGNGSGNIGDNWAFTRIRRNSGGAAATVTAHFLVSKFGTGSSYVDNSSIDPDVILDPGDATIAFAAGDVGPHITPAYHWHLSAIAGNHLCLAVEISAPNDPYIPPSLLGAAPGWTTGTDIRVVDDNNKAQRNMGLTTTPARGAGMTPSFCAIAHNAAMVPRSMTLQYEVDPEVLRRLKEINVAVVGEQKATRTIREPSGSIALEGMQPGENRWVCSTFGSPEGKEGEILPINFNEMVNGIAVNGFAVGPRLASIADTVHDNLELHRGTFTQMHSLFDITAAKEEANSAEQLLREKATNEQQFLDFVRRHLKSIKKAVHELLESQHSEDPFAVQTAFKTFATAVDSGKFEDISVAHASLMNRLDSFQTMQALAKGDPADVLQMVRWQEHLYSTVPQLKQLHSSDFVVKESREFIRDFVERRRHADTYPDLMRELHNSFKEAGEALEKIGVKVEREIDQMEDAGKSVTRLQKAHRDYLLRLQNLMPAPPGVLP
jgi:hypothetical protein